MNVPGASSVYREGYITYSNGAKEKLLGVEHQTLETVGAVSPETAEQMKEISEVLERYVREEAL